MRHPSVKGRLLERVDRLGWGRVLKDLLGGGA